jgi:phage recombination protein Bet
MTDRFLTDKDLKTLEGMYAGDDDRDHLTRNEFDQFVAAVERRRLDPFSKQIYWTKRLDRHTNRFKFGIEATIDGFRVIADRSGNYAGQQGPYWCGEDGVWRDVWLGKGAPRAAKVGVLRHGFTEPMFAVANWDGYYQDRSMIWKGGLGPLMIAKCAEALALRKAYPQDLSGIYTSDEMAQVGATTDETAEAQGKRRKPPETAPQPAQAEEAPAKVSPPPEQETLPTGPEDVSEVEVVETPTTAPADEPTDAQRDEYRKLVRALGLKRPAISEIAHNLLGKAASDVNAADVDKLNAHLRNMAEEQGLTP